MTVGVERAHPSIDQHQHRVVVVHPDDNVAVALDALEAGSIFTVGRTRESVTEVPSGHKVALSRISTGDPVIKYGFPIGRATTTIEPGEWVHSHNLATALSGTL
ncbi:MAG TPA: UxaA family hydrolase, partial [Gemmatimonadaceae bacterium]|nr:UxaA family hydrolase [Gemmatimonadaceae bacterium]